MSQNKTKHNKNTQNTVMKPLQVGELPVQLPSKHMIRLIPLSWNPSLHKNDTDAPCLVSLLSTLPFLGA